MAESISIEVWLVVWPPLSAARRGAAGIGGHADRRIGSAQFACTDIDADVATKIDRPLNWAQPFFLPDATDLHKVSDVLYRSAQPTAEGMQNLKDLGIKTVISLRAFRSDRDKMGSTGLGYEYIFMKNWHPEREDVVRFLKAANDPDRLPVLVHCQHGADRTGSMVAIYRVAVQGWNVQQAAQEMTNGGYGFHSVWVNLVPWLNTLDIEAIRRDAGLQVSPQ